MKIPGVIPVCIAWGLALLLQGCGQAANDKKASYSRTEHGAVVKVADAHVELAAEGSSAFRVSVSMGGAPQQRESPMVIAKPSTAYAATKVSQSGSVVSVSAGFGTAKVDCKSGSFELLDAAGKSLLKSSVFSSFDGDYLTVKLGAPASEQRGPYYGAGVAAGSPLSVDKCTPQVGNQYGAGAHSWAPQYYSAAQKYGALAVGSADFSNRTEFWTNGMPDFAKYPANWTSNNDGVTWMVLGKTVDLYLMPANDTYAYLKAHAELTGAPHIPPRYAFGFLAGRWGWKTKAYINETLHRFREGKFPCDAFISDFYWFTVFNDYDVPPSGDPKYFDFGYNNVTFPEPAEQLKSYHEMGFRFGGIRKPRVGSPDSLKTCRENGWLLPEGLYNANGQGRNINFTTPESREWYAQQNAHYVDDGVDFWWNDEGEVMFYHFDGWNRAQAEGLKKKQPDKRFFSINRAFTPGQQRYGLSVWTGDISTSWDALAQQPGYLLNYGLAGMPYVGCDTGGFVGPNASAELLSRWYWNSAFMTIMRVHSNMNFDDTGHGKGIPVIPHFPWLYGEEAEVAMRKALEMRYSLIPMLYSLAHTAFATGAPIMRPLFLEFGHDAKAAAITDQWLVGRDMMTAPILAPGGKRSVYFPSLPKGSQWYQFNVSNSFAGGTTEDVKMALDETPVYCRSGAVVPVGPVIQHTGQLGGSLQLQVYAGLDGSFILVEDDGMSTAYTEGKVRTTTFKWTDATKTLTWSVAGETVDSRMFVSVKVVLFEPGLTTSSVLQKLGEDGEVAFKASKQVVVV